MIFGDEDLDLGLSEEMLNEEGLMSAILVVSAILAGIGSAIGFVIILLLTALFILIISKIAKLTLSYKQVLAIMTLAQVPIIFYSFVEMLTINLTGDVIPITSLAFFAGGDISAFWLTMLGSIELFTLWIYALIGIGLATFAGVSVRKGMIVSYSYWLISTLVVAMFAYWAETLSTML